MTVFRIATVLVVAVCAGSSAAVYSSGDLGRTWSRVSP
jgi:hypothetical protein